LYKEAYCASDVIPFRIDFFREATIPFQIDLL